MRRQRDRLGALANELRPGAAPTPPRRSYARSFDDGTTIELQTEEELYRPPSIPANESNGDGAEDVVRAQGLSHWTALRASWSAATAPRAAPVPASEPPSQRRARRRRLRAEQRPMARAMNAPAAPPAPTPVPQPTPRAVPDADESLLDPDVLRKDLQGLPSRAQPPAPSDDAAPTAPPPSDATEAPKLTHEIFDELRRGQAGQALAAMKSASKPQTLGHAIFDRFPRGLSQAATYDVGAFDVKRRFDDLDRRLEAAWTAPPAQPSLAASAAPALLPFELREDLEQMRADAKPAPAPVAQEPDLSADTEQPKGAEP